MPDDFSPPEQKKRVYFKIKVTLIFIRENDFFYDQ